MRNKRRLPIDGIKLRLIFLLLFGGLFLFTGRFSGKEAQEGGETEKSGETQYGTNDRDIEEDENEYLLEIIQAGMNQEGTKDIDKLFSRRVFSHPKPLSLVRSLARVSTENKDVVLDFFAGSGTTGHAVIDLNREENGSRRFILAEVGAYFDTVLKPRIQKAIFSRKWKEGKPEDCDGVSHLTKYLRLESYEDATDNLVLTRTEEQ